MKKYNVVIYCTISAIKTVKSAKYVKRFGENFMFLYWGSSLL